MPESEEKTVLIIHPDIRTTGPVLLGEDGKPVSYLQNIFKDTTEKLLTRYQGFGYDVVGVVFADTTPSDLSPLYPTEKFNRLISESSLKDWRRDTLVYEFGKVATELNPTLNSRFVVGGYRYCDCVVEMARVLKRFSNQVSIDLKLTDYLGEILIAHYIRRMAGSLYSKKDRCYDRLIWETTRSYITELAGI